MSDLPDDITDKLFQEGAVRFDFTYNPEAWGQMEEMLDVEKKRRRILSVLLYTFIGLVVATGFYLLLGSNTVEIADGTVQGVIESEEQLVPMPENSHTSEFDDLLEKPSNEATPPKTHSRSEGPFEENFETDEPNLKSNQQIVATNSFSFERDPEVENGKFPITDQSYELTSFQEERSLALSNKVSERVNTSADTQTLVSNGSSRTIQNEAKLGDILAADFQQRSSINFINTDFSALKSKPLSKVYSDFSAAEEDLMKISYPLVSASGKSSLFSRFSVKAHGGVIYGVTEDSGIGMPRTRYGLGLGYAVNENWVLSSGLTINNLCYITNGEGYKTKQTNWFGGVLPSRIEALCRVLEIPMEASYHINGNKSAGFYFRGGVLNYILLQEDYSYSYEQSDIPPNVEIASLRKSWQEVNTNRHFLGVAQFSVGYQVPISKSSQLQLEGYVQAPMSGIGHGDVQVWSFGINTAINLHLK